MFMRRVLAILVAAASSEALIVTPSSSPRARLAQPKTSTALQQLAGIAAAVVIAATPTPVAAAPQPASTITIADADSYTPKTKAERDAFKAAMTEAKSKASKAQTARGTPAKLPAAASSSDVSIALRSSALKLDPRDLKLPNSIGLNLPVVGPLRIDLNVQISKSTAEEVADSDLVVLLPKDLVRAGKLAAGGVAGVAIDAPGVASGRLDLDLSTPTKGEADIAVTSKLIPKLPLQKTKGLGRFCFECGNGEPDSEWFLARNLGSGVQFYGNAKTGQSQFEVPKGF